MAFYADEEDAWKCPKHPSKRRRSGICHVCLRERLSSLCPDCAAVRPCFCCATPSSSSSSGGDAVGSFGRLSSLIESEPSFCRSRSVAIPFLRSSSRFVGGDRSEPASGGKTSAFWSVFRSKSKRIDGEGKKLGFEEKDDVMRRTMMTRSRSVAVPVTSSAVAAESKPARGRSWYFPSPIKVFRQSKISKIVQERSPLYRG